MQNPLDPSETFLSYFKPSIETTKRIKRNREDSDDEDNDEVNHFINKNSFYHYNK